MRGIRCSCRGCLTSRTSVFQEGFTRLDLSGRLGEGGLHVLLDIYILRVTLGLWVSLPLESFIHLVEREKSLIKSIWSFLATSFWPVFFMYKLFFFFFCFIFQSTSIGVGATFLFYSLSTFFFLPSIFSFQTFLVFLFSLQSLNLLHWQLASSL